MSTKKEQKITISAKQCRAGRELLGWKQIDLSNYSEIGIATIADFEREHREPISRTLRDLRNTFENAGIEFINDGGIGVILKD